MTAPVPAGLRVPGRGAAFGTVLAVLFLTFLDTTIVSVTLGNLEGDVSAGVIPLQWVINAYALTFASLMLVGGSLADRFGRKWVMLAGVAIFCVGSLMAALAGGVGMVIAGRAVMGLGAAGCEPGTLSIVRQLFGERRQRARALGAWSAISGLALALGPVIGGLLVAAGSWRTVFWFNLAAGLLIAALVLRFVPNSADPRAGRTDLAGFVLGTAGIGILVYAAITGEYKGYATWWILTLFVVGVLALVAFVAVERRVAAPMLDLAIVRRPIVSSALFAAFAVYFAVFAIFFLTALYLDLGLGYSPVKLAGTFTPMAITIVAGGLVAGPWVARAGTRLPSVAGCGLGAVGLVLAWRVIGDASGDAKGVISVNATLLSVAVAVAGLGFGITVVPLTSSVLSHVPASMSGMAASATNTARQLGAVVGVAALGAIANAHLVNALKDPNTALGALGGGFVGVLETGGSGGFDIAKYREQYPAVLKPFIDAFADGLQTALLVAAVLIVLAGIASALVREPAVEQDS